MKASAKPRLRAGSHRSTRPGSGIRATGRDRHPYAATHATGPVSRSTSTSGNSDASPTAATRFSAGRPPAPARTTATERNTPASPPARSSLSRGRGRVRVRTIKCRPSIRSRAASRRPAWHAVSAMTCSRTSRTVCKCGSPKRWRGHQARGVSAPAAATAVFVRSASARYRSSTSVCDTSGATCQASSMSSRASMTAGSPVTTARNQNRSTSSARCWTSPRQLHPDGSAGGLWCPEAADRSGLVQRLSHSDFCRAHESPPSPSRRPPSSARFASLRVRHRKQVLQGASVRLPGASTLTVHGSAPIDAASCAVSKVIQPGRGALPTVAPALRPVSRRTVP